MGTSSGFVAINVLTVPEGGGSTLESRFAARQGAVDSAPGFEHFELLRPVDGTDSYLVYTRWRSREDFEAWRASQSFGQGHAQASGRGEGEQRAATGSTIWAFDVAQESDGAPDRGSAGGMTQPAHEDVEGVPVMDPGPRQEGDQGLRSPEEQGTLPPEDPDGEPPFV